jgi:hypothetical protein
MAQLRLSKKRYCVVFGFRPLVRGSNCVAVFVTHMIHKMTGSTTGHKRVGSFVDRGRTQNSVPTCCALLETLPYLFGLVVQLKTLKCLEKFRRCLLLSN